MIQFCETCPWLKKNQGKRHSAGWYTVANIRRLWAGIRTGRAPGMICHSTDPKNSEYGGKGNVKSGTTATECAGALLMSQMTIQAYQENKPQPFKPPMTKFGLAVFVERFIFSGVTEVEDRTSEVGLPWQKDAVGTHPEGR